jgi:hypothetical protein
MTPSPLVLGLLAALATPLVAAEPARAQPELPIGGGRIAMEFTGPTPDAGDDALRTWTVRAAEAVSDYYGRYPVPRLHLEVEIDDGERVHGGHERDGNTIEICVGRHVTPDMLASDWRLTHEMIHLAFPDLDRSELWMEEGLATYLEPIARVRVGQIDAERVWGDLVDGLPKGLPERGDRGLDRTHTWGRTYWGGALFWLLADIEIRERSHGERSLRDALRAILDAGGDNSQPWKVDRVIAVADAAAGAPVLDGLYRRLALAPGREDLEALWRKLGVRVEEGRVAYDDRAPDAKLRVAITAR